MADYIHIWSIQDRGSLIGLRENGYIRCKEDKCGMLRFYAKGKRIEDRKSKEAYDWLVEKLKDRIGNPPAGVVYPMWGWYQYEGSTDGIMERYSSYHYGRIGRNQKRQIVYELEIPKERVCLTDYDEWHYPLNNWYLGDCKNEEEFNKENEWLSSLSYDEHIRVKRESWNKIFDWSTKVDTDWIKRGFYTQACIWEIKREDIVKVHELKWR